MTCSVHESENGLVLELAGEVTIGQTAKIREELLKALFQTTHITVSLKGVTDMDTSGLQLLMSAQKAAEKSGIKFNFTGQPPAFRRAAERISLTGGTEGPFVGGNA